jgi:hypothetical protein
MAKATLSKEGLKNSILPQTCMGFDSNVEI